MSGISPASNRRRSGHRTSFIRSLLEQASATGYCRFYADHCMDDEPEHPILECARVFEEAMAAREGRRPHLEPPGTLLGDLRKQCEARGWELTLADPINREFMIVVPRKSVTCANCQGCGRIPQSLSVYDPPPHFTVKTCSACGGTGQVMRASNEMEKA